MHSNQCSTLRCTVLLRLLLLLLPGLVCRLVCLLLVFFALWRPAHLVPGVLAMHLGGLTDSKRVAGRADLCFGWHARCHRSTTLLAHIRTT